MTSEKPALYVYERLFALSAAGFFALLICLNLYLSEKELAIDEQHPYQMAESLIEVTITGKVKKPGTYQVKKGTTVSDAVQMAEPAPGANLQKTKMDSKITRRRKITIR